MNSHALHDFALQRQETLLADAAHARLVREARRGGQPSGGRSWRAGLATALHALAAWIDGRTRAASAGPVPAPLAPLPLPAPAT